MSVWAILVAAGRGERLGTGQPKAFAKLGELPLLAEPLRRLDDSEWVDAIIVVAPPGWEEPAILLAEEIGAAKVRAVVPGGGGPAEQSEAERLGEIERQAIMQALRKHDFNRTETAKALGISRRALIYKLQRFRELGYEVDAPSR